MDNLYKLAWIRGLKTTYYLRSLGATHVEKSHPERGAGKTKLAAVERAGSEQVDPEACTLDDTECESCQ